MQTVILQQMIFNVLFFLFLLLLLQFHLLCCEILLCFPFLEVLIFVDDVEEFSKTHF